MTLRVQGRELTEAHLAEIRQLRTEHATWSRLDLSVALAERWHWRNDAGRLKDMAARTLLLKLQARGLIDLPPPRRRNGRRRAQPPEFGPELFAQTAPFITGSLQDLRPLRWKVVQSREQRRQVRQRLERYHYRGYAGAVGENVQ